MLKGAQNMTCDVDARGGVSKTLKSECTTANQSSGRVAIKLKHGIRFTQHKGS